jgi:hypothetical protein
LLKIELGCYKRAETDKKIVKAVKDALAKQTGGTELRGTLRSINGAMK